MANEITITAGLSIFKASCMDASLGMAIPAGVFSMSGSFVVKETISVDTSPMLIPMGQVSAPHWAFFRNCDATNFIRIFNGISGTPVLKLLAGEAFPCGLDDTGTYYAQADTAACLMQYLIASL